MYKEGKAIFILQSALPLEKLKVDGKHGKLLKWQLSRGHSNFHFARETFFENKYGKLLEGHQGQDQGNRGIVLCGLYVILDLFEQFVIVLTLKVHLL